MPITSPAVGDQATAAWAVSVAAQLNAGGWIGGNSSLTTVALSTAATDVAGSASVTFTLASTRRVRIDVWASYRLGTATGGRMNLAAAYNTGGSVSLGSAVQIGIGQAIANFTGTSGTGGQTSIYNAYTVLLTAGTYTAYAVVNRLTGGNTADLGAAFVTIVTDLGAS